MRQDPFSALSKDGNSEVFSETSECSSCHLLFLLLLLLLIPALVGAYFLVRYHRRHRYRQLAQQLKLSGKRKPGEVDDLEMGHFIGGGEWLTGRKYFQGSGIDNNILPVYALQSEDEFDPIHEEAKVQRRRRLLRRRVDDTNSVDVNESEMSAGATADFLLEGEKGEDRGATGMYNATTAGVWLRKLHTVENTDQSLAKVAPAGNGKTTPPEATQLDRLTGVTTGVDVPETRMEGNDSQLRMGSDDIEKVLATTFSSVEHAAEFSEKKQDAQEYSVFALYSSDEDA